MKPLLALLAIASATALAATHSATYTWTTPQAGTTALFIATGACGSTAPTTGTQINSSTSQSGSYVYSTVTAATTYCGWATVTGVAAPSNLVTFTIPVFTPTGLSCSQVSGTMNAACAWTASTDAGSTVTILDSPSACGTSGQVFSALASGLAAGGPFTITSMAAGTYCVEVEAVIGGVTSPASTPLTVAIASAAGSPPIVSVKAQ